MMMGGP